VHTLIRVSIHLLCRKIDLSCLCSSEIGYVICGWHIGGLYASDADVEDSRNNPYNILSG
jgi:hypothetical protein